MKRLQSFFFSSSNNRFNKRQSSLVRKSPSNRRLRLEPLEKRELLAVDALGASELYGPPTIETFSIANATPTVAALVSEPVANASVNVDVNLDPNVSGVAFSIRRDNSNLKFWRASSKSGGEYEFTNGECGLSGSCCIWAEYASTGNTNYTLTLVARDSSTGAELFTEEMTFRPFNSVLVIISGRNQTPSNPINNATHAIVQMALDLYSTEVYDVHVYPPSDVGDCNSGLNMGNGIAYNEIVNAINNRGVNNIGLAGYSYGGGAIYGLSQRLHRNKLPVNHTDRLNDIANNYSIDFAAYIDAIMNGSYLAYAQNTPPIDVEHFYNRYQTNDRDYYNYYFQIFGQAFVEAYNNNQNCNNLTVIDPEDNIERFVDHYIIDDLVCDELAIEIQTYLTR
ncbi:MAG: hypothetical protein Q4C95_12255 [Planctomycetia bacterium]|nr:hypothetical protein [Planctomycetia bacterium]